MRLGALLAGVILCAPLVGATRQDALPSWNDGAAKRAIVRFVDDVTRPGTPTFVPPAERIATFDNDGTLWAEQPLYFQFVFALDRVKTLAPEHPEWKERRPFKAVLEGDYVTVLAGGDAAVAELVMPTHAGMTTDEFAKTVRDWLATARHPRLHRPYTECIYQPRSSYSPTCARTASRRSSCPEAVSNSCASGASACTAYRRSRSSGARS